MGLLRQGKRHKTRADKKQANKHMKGFYKILHELEEVAINIKKDNREVTEDNIVDIASEYTERKIETFEKNILLSKLKGNEN